MWEENGILAVMCLLKNTDNSERFLHVHSDLYIC